MLLIRLKPATKQIWLTIESTTCYNILYYKFFILNKFIHI